MISGRIADGGVPRELVGGFALHWCRPREVAAHVGNWLAVASAAWRKRGPCLLLSGQVCAAGWGALGYLSPWLDLPWSSWLLPKPMGSSLQTPGAFCRDSLLLLSGGCVGPPGAPALWGSFACLWLQSPSCPHLVLGDGSMAPHTNVKRPYVHQHAQAHTHTQVWGFLLSWGLLQMHLVIFGTMRSLMTLLLYLNIYLRVLVV